MMRKTATLLTLLFHAQLLALALTINSASAAEPAQPDAAAASVTTGTTAAPDTSSADAASDADTRTAGDNANNEANNDVNNATDEEANVAATPRSSNEPFIPTVQISEDLSVSFPVDI